ncbi:hypothetical protein V1290_003788 [Bradyrhizobium sp. AZCC 1578]|uniref:hypothetical protein n=1 Tax=Bradyrhizobium sp. AZCC 1578 TaxID=3117027 RepID=UPI002FEF2FE1
MTEFESTPLQKTYREARRVAGKHATQMVLVANGATTGHLPDVPPANRAKCQRDLQKLIDGASAGTDAKRVDHGGDSFAAIRERAYGTRERPKAATKLDPVAIYDRWNNPPPVERD